MITFISAANGGIELTVEGHTSTYWAAFPQSLADFIKQFGISDACFHSSTMDFAEEEGFKDNNAAWNLFNTAMSNV